MYIYIYLGYAKPCSRATMTHNDPKLGKLFYNDPNDKLRLSTFLNFVLKILF